MWSSGWYYGCGNYVAPCYINYCASGCGVTPYYYPCGPRFVGCGCGYGNWGY